MKLHIFTLNWNGGDKLNKLAFSLLRDTAKFSHDYCWHLRDNGSSSPLELNCVDSRFLNTKIYNIGHNRDNFAKGMNYLYHEAKPDSNDLILLLNNDVVFSCLNALTRMHEVMEKTDAAIVGTRLMYPDKTLQHAGVIFGKRYGEMPYHFRHKEASDANAEKDRYFQAVTAAVCLIKADAWKAVGGMNEGYNWSFEDIDFNLKVGATGRKIAYAGRTNVFHEESASLKKNPVNKMFLRQNVDLFKKTWFGKYKLDHELYLKDPNYKVIL